MSGDPSPRDGPEPLVVPWQGRQLRVRYDDPRLSPYSPYSPRGSTLRGAIELANDVEGLRLALRTAPAIATRVDVSEDGTVVGL